MNNESGSRLPDLSPEALAAIRDIRALPKGKAYFTLLVSEEGHSRPLTVINNGFGRDSEYRVLKAPSGKMPRWAQPESTYIAQDDTSFVQMLRLFAEHPELFSKAPGDLLDIADCSLCDGERDSWGNLNGGNPND